MKARHREDTVIGVLWAMGMSTGIVFMHMTPGYNTDLMTYLFGNILLISQTDLYILVALNAVVIFTVVTLHRQFVAVSFDEEYSSLTGISVTVIYILLLSLIALTIVILIQVVGLILVIAMMTIPSAIALIFFHNIYKIILCAIFCGIVFNSSGLIISYMTNLPAGSMIILLSGSVYLLLLLVINVVLKR